MNAKNVTEAQKAAWSEREVHESIMQAISEVYGDLNSYFYINGNYYYWSIKELPEGEPERIAKRGNHEEILYMIHQYGKTKCDFEKYRHYVWSNYNNVSGAHLSDEVQRIILERNDPEEIAAYVLYHGFSPAGQDFIIERGDHNEIMRYLFSHGFAPEQQLRLWERGNKDEIKLQISRHGCGELILSKLFDELEENEETAKARFLECIDLHELPVPFQIRMLKQVSHELFMAYISRYGLWLEAHADLIRERSIEEVMAYIDKHHFLSDEGERQLAQRHVTRLTQYYLQNRVKKSSKSIFDELLRAAPLDREAMGTFFLTLVYPNDYCPDEQYQLMKEGRQEDVLAYIEKHPLGMKSIAALFFRDDRAPFKAYVKRWCKVNI